jgi:hypothetical protein
MKSHIYAFVDELEVKLKNIEDHVASAWLQLECADAREILGDIRLSLKTYDSNCTLLCQQFKRPLC